MCSLHCKDTVIYTPARTEKLNLFERVYFEALQEVTCDHILIKIYSNTCVCVSHSVRSVGRGVSVTVAVLWSAQPLPLCSLVIGDYSLHCAICKTNMTDSKFT